ncbi:hypothetical protein FR483_n104L [Paramecium bursaria Chlorella virus FR483]|uniref:Uncharacterized protein n104L n=1 Tax=Paramecium bursaria Chlorella virus FR483 TaxID=399781 RepID=A7J6F8_PBCVF|nr:hypothetical protein FR483_n104L [Paramecium bursaria Chlorella virus FR483]ABT15389.1 hypothetical protein FR483_n104L [Paramecium bursaria Chlorella virus FR483]
MLPPGLCVAHFFLRLLGVFLSKHITLLPKFCFAHILLGFFCVCFSKICVAHFLLGLLGMFLSIHGMLFTGLCFAHLPLGFLTQSLPIHMTLLTGHPIHRMLFTGLCVAQFFLGFFT